MNTTVNPTPDKGLEYDLDDGVCFIGSPDEKERGRNRFEFNYCASKDLTDSYRR